MHFKKTSGNNCMYPNNLHVNIEVQGLPVLTPIYTLLQPVTGWSLKQKCKCLFKLVVKQNYSE